MKTNPPIKITADFEYKNVPAEDHQQKTLLMNQPVAVVYKIENIHIMIT